MCESVAVAMLIRARIDGESGGILKGNIIKVGVELTDLAMALEVEYQWFHENRKKVERK